MHASKSVFDTEGMQHKWEGKPVKPHQSARSSRTRLLFFPSFIKPKIKHSCFLSTAKQVTGLCEWRVLCFVVVGETTSFPSSDHGWGGDGGGRVRRIWAPFTGQMECQSSASTQMRCPPRGEPRCFPVMRLCCSWPTLGALGIFCPFTPPHPLVPLQIPLWLLMIFSPTFLLLPKFTISIFFLIHLPPISSFTPVGIKILSGTFRLALTAFLNILQHRRQMRFGGLQFFLLFFFLSFLKKRKRTYPTMSVFPSACHLHVRKQKATRYIQIQIKHNWVRLVTDKWGREPLILAPKSLHLSGIHPIFFSSLIKWLDYTDSLNK